MNLDVNNQHWLAIQVKPRHEFTTSTILRNKGYEEFVPKYTIRRKWSDRHRVMELPLFSGYVFCRLRSEACLPIVTTPGVIRILRTGNNIGLIDDREIEAIQALTKSGLRAEPCAYLNVGQLVRVIDGPLIGTEGILKTVRNRRLVLSVSLVQGSVAVEIDGYSVVPVNAGSRGGRQVA